MKMLKKLALVSAISMISAGAFAIEAMDDESMASTIGQDGITINIIPAQITYSDAAGMGVTDATMAKIAGVGDYPSVGFKGLSIGEIRVHDDDGLGALGSAATANSGALVIGGGDIDEGGTKTALSDRIVVLAKGDKPIQINVDMVGDYDGTGPKTGAMLNVEIKQPKLAVKLGNIYVANSNAAQAGYDAAGAVNAGGEEVDGTDITTGSKVKVLDGFEIVMAESTMNIQLGNEAQGHMIKADAELTDGLVINNFALYDQDSAADLTADDLLTGNVGSGGSIRAKSIVITDTGDATKLTAKTFIDVGSRISAGAVSTTARDANFSTVFTALNGTFSTVFTNYGITAASTDAAVGTALGTATTAAATAAGNLSTANTTLATARNAKAQADYTKNYDQLTTVEKAAVDLFGAVVTAQTDVTAKTTADANAKGAVKGLTFLATGTSGKVGSVNAAVAADGTWGGKDTYNGLVITSQLGGANGADITINNLALGDTNAAIMGDIQIIGLKLGSSKIVIMGH